MKYARPNQPLKAHLIGVAEKTAGRLPSKWQRIGYYAGLWHDLGKILQQWQNYLLYNGRRVPHSPHGAMLALSFSKRFKDIPSLTFVIAGHHGGLKNIENYTGDDFQERAKGWDKARDEANSEIADFIPPELPEFDDLKGTRREFAIRMLFGCLVDADRMDAALFSKGNTSSNLDETSTMTELSTSFNPRYSDGSLATLRREFASSCITKANAPCGLFRLTGPTGVGKTIASLRFAIVHCQTNKNLEGILYIGPLKSVIDQTWRVYCDALRMPVLSHYSDFQPSEEEASDYKLTTERWNAPVICTSGVQFYESLFANSAAKCRKLSHLMNRCILIDEAQTIPLEYAKPILDVFKALVNDWGCTIVLMSATQPSFQNIDREFDQQCTDIISDSQSLKFFTETRRVIYDISFEAWQWSQIADRISSSSQSLTIVNTTKLAQEGFIALSETIDESWFHLSARMVPAHRQQELDKIVSRLERNLPCQVISTQVVEAGIDLDFPLVLRQMAPLDSIIQAAGRCNRENTMSWQDATVQVFDLEDSNYPSSDYKTRTNITRDILKNYDLNEKLLEAIALYYQKCYVKELVGDKYDIQKFRRELKFEQVEKLVKIIDDSYQFSAFVPWKEGDEILKSFDLSEPLNESDWRKLQPYTINLPKKLEYMVEKHPCGLNVLHPSFYSNQFGVFEPM